MEITAAVLPAPKQKFKLDTIQLDTRLRPEEILVKIVATGLCHTDLAVRDQQIPFEIPAILGHEGAGIVEEVGSSVTKVKKGDHVILAPASCGKCSFRKSGHPSERLHCRRLYQHTGGIDQKLESCIHSRIKRFRGEGS